MDYIGEHYRVTKGIEFFVLVSGCRILQGLEIHVSCVSTILNDHLPMSSVVLSAECGIGE